MNRVNLPLNKSCSYDDNSPSRISQPSLCPISNGMMTENGHDKLKVIKVESMSSQQLKRRRSRSHNLSDYSSGDLFSADYNNAPCCIRTYGSSQDSSQLLQNPLSINNHWNKEKHKKETHNRIERKRRDFINGQIQRLADLLPSELFFNYDLKMNKGVILKNSADYITSLRSVEEVNRQLILENQSASRIIHTLISLNDINCSDLSINEDNAGCREGSNVNDMIKEWDNVRQANKELLQKFQKKQSNFFSENKIEMSYENISAVDSSNNNPILASSSRKRYSSVPTNISNDLNSSNGLQNITIIDKNAPILNSLLKKSDPYKQNIKESDPPTFSMENVGDNISYYLQSNKNSSHQCSDICAEDNTDFEHQLSDIRSNENIFQIKSKMYYILPKSSKSSPSVQLNQRLVQDPNPDPMLLSDNITFENVEH